MQSKSPCHAQRMLPYLNDRDRGLIMGDLLPSSSMEGLLSPDEKCLWWWWWWEECKCLSSSTVVVGVDALAAPLTEGRGAVDERLATPPPTPIWWSLSWLEHCDCRDRDTFTKQFK